MDSFHLACTLSLHPLDEVVIASADLELLSAASHEGLTALNTAVPHGKTASRRVPFGRVPWTKAMRTGGIYIKSMPPGMG